MACVGTILASRRDYSSLGGAVDQVAWEDLHYQIVAHCSSRATPPKIPEAQRFTSVTRLREIEPGMEAVLEVFGKVREGERSHVGYAACFLIINAGVSHGRNGGALPNASTRRRFHPTHVC